MASKTIFTLLLAWMALSAHAQSTIIYDDTISIKTEIDTTIQHVNHDVEVVYKDNWYIIDYYAYHGEVVQRYQIKFQAGGLYDKVNYVWQTETQAIIRLFDSETTYSRSFKVWGGGSGPMIEMVRN